MQRRLNSETAVNKPFENVSCQGRIQKFFQGGGTNFRHFSSVFFPAELILSNLNAKNDFREVRGMLPRKFFENSYSLLQYGHFSFLNNL